MRAIAAILDATASSKEAGPAPHAIALRAHLEGVGALSKAEESLMREWLDSIVEA
ncbi:hypothetical protein [uncultured Croceicoccus sp.]|uniref:hypothetical protein n=1 Tax=uncultured Croceicoccus sp. TaxID=1295329 RepID=UPI00261981D4|nr:hypothetical protein [uncultured Croceicoccus sp.]